MALELASGPDFGCNRYCKTNPVDQEGPRVQVLAVWGGFWKVLGGRRMNCPLWPEGRLRQGSEGPRSLDVSRGNPETRMYPGTLGARVYPSGKAQGWLYGGSVVVVAVSKG